MYQVQGHILSGQVVSTLIELQFTSFHEILDCHVLKTAPALALTCFMRWCPDARAASRQWCIPPGYTILHILLHQSSVHCAGPWLTWVGSPTPSLLRNHKLVLAGVAWKHPFQTREDNLMAKTTFRKHWSSSCTVPCASTHPPWRSEIFTCRTEIEYPKLSRISAGNSDPSSPSNTNMMCLPCDRCRYPFAAQILP